jgi:dual-specificity kinase
VDSAKTERNIVKTLNEADPLKRSRIVRFVESFYHYQYYCIVFEPLGPSLYDVVKRNNHTGFPLALVQAFARQVFEAVAFMHANHYTHTDLKPENILLCADDLKKMPHSKLDNYLLPSD